MFKFIVDFLKYLFEEKREYYGYSDYGKFGEVYDKSNVGECILYQKNEESQKVLNLFTKKKYFAKLIYASFEKSILDMKRVCLENNIDKISMPKIGSGKDKLSWSKNREIIKKIFENTEIEIIVCFQ